jgi:hypothetical protein
VPLGSKNNWLTLEQAGHGTATLVTARTLAAGPWPVHLTVTLTDSSQAVQAKFKVT